MIKKWVNISGEILVADGENARVLRLNADGEITGEISIGPKEKSSTISTFVGLVAFDDDQIVVGYTQKSGEIITEWYNTEDISAIREVRLVLRRSKWLSHLTI